MFASITLNLKYCLEKKSEELKKESRQRKQQLGLTFRPPPLHLLDEEKQRRISTAGVDLVALLVSCKDGPFALLALE